MVDFYNSLIETLYFTMPAWLSNTFTAIFYYFFIVKYKILPAWPLDFGLKFKNKRIFGDNKTFFGSLSTIFFGAIIGFFQNSFFTGLIFGIATLLGSLLNSFIKRQLNIPPGGSFFPFDQIDYALMSLFFIYLFDLAFFHFQPFIFLSFVFIYQLLVNFLAFKLGFIKKFLWLHV